MKPLPFYVWAAWWSMITVGVVAILIMAFFLGFLGPVVAPVFMAVVIGKSLPATMKSFEIEIRKRRNGKA